MSNYKFDSIVSRTEAEALKDMIFKRARERAAALNEDAQTSYSTAVKNDVMDLARDSFVSSKNPFSIKETQVHDVPVTDVNEEETAIAREHVADIKAQIMNKNRVENESLVIKQVEQTMVDASTGLRNKKTFMGALDFLNSQASISLIKKGGRGFDAIA